ncbi:MULTISPECIES: hypothetical protein [Chryseobacterium]|jgi:hypothetical protein|uniref:Cell wall anchor protein n=1 Tax=Chryseobacterium rhizosphaerae TaxID=395937 RepID=A0ABX9IJH1_9FLAO|nr:MULTISPECIES: hypothetical protein [Chryseobacterium]REC74853.1 hypothetical protein DRF57_12510 [Chryseobacterium rhizosphaerae]GEN67779.1 hypothetical protein CRH01_23470 [Chryseobacterium rhizosphaerae]SMC32464.1 hypothetical protein SAMN02787074_0303 [Chryseobacterium sp. YR221]
MKKITVILFALLGANSLFSQQWTGNNTNTDPIYRGGSVSVGTAQSYDKFTVGKGNLRMVDGAVKFGYFTPGIGVNHDSYFTIQNFRSLSGSNANGLYIYPSHSGLSPINDVPSESKVFFVSSTSKIGMGTNTLTCVDCDDYRLFVKDGIKTEKLKVEIAANNGWADYVFAKDYKLMPLKELQAYIDDKGHLPEVPTTEEAIKNGIELKEMNILLLKKVEELTLYTLQQQNQMEKQQKFMDEQNKRIEILEKKHVNN